MSDRATLADVLASGDRRTVDRWVSGGRVAVDELHGELSGERRCELPPGTSDREVIDNLAMACAAIADAEPAAYLDAFGDPVFRSNTFVLDGFGFVADPRVTAWLVDAAGDESEWVRMSAAIALGRPAHATSAPTLAALLDDEAYLVRYHALKGLAQNADKRCEPALRRFLDRVDVAEVERDLARAALRAIARLGRA